jgi:UDP-N-acetylmuramate dehydrogenase
MNDKFLKLLIENGIKYELDYPTSKLSSFELGGKTKTILFPKEMNEFCEILCFLRQNDMKFYIVGACTNTFFSDEGFEGAIVSTSLLNKSFCENNTISAMCGALVTDLSVLAMKNGLSGMEFCLGIPGSVGGAIAMNASAFESTMSNIVLKSEVVDLRSGKRFIIDNKEHLFEKKSSLITKNRNFVLLNTQFILERQEKSSIYNEMKRIAFKRMRSQPLDKGSCGSAFKRPLCGYASKMIDNARLKGEKIGNVAISNKHAGFIVNLGCGNTRDVLKLTAKIKKEILDKFGSVLEEEFIFVE